MYGIHERDIINTDIKVLEDNDLICDCVDPWSSLLLLAANPHQEGYKDIKTFIWRLFVRYRILNSVTRRFAFPIPHSADSIEYFGDSYGHIYFILLDTRSGYHLVCVYKGNQ